MADEPLTLQERVESALNYDDASLAYDIIQELEPSLSDTKISEDSRKKIEKIKARLAAVCMKYLGEVTVGAIFEKYPVEFVGVRDEVDFMGHLKMLLQLEVTDEEKDRLKEKWRGALLRSQQVLGKEYIQLGSETVPPQIDNWFKLYTTIVGTGEVTSLKRAKFFSQNLAFQSLSLAEKRILRRIIDVYQFLKKSSGEIGGNEYSFVVELENGKLGFVNGDTAVSLYTDDELKKLRKRALEGELDLKTLLDLKRAYPEVFSGIKFEPKKQQVKPTIDLSTLSAEQIQAQISAFFEDQLSKYSPSVEYDPPRIPAGTSAIVQEIMDDLKNKDENTKFLIRDLLKNVVSESEKLTNFMRQGVIRTLLDKIVQNQPDVKARIIADPMGAEAFQLLLKYFFGTELGLREEEVAWHSYEIIEKVSERKIDFKTIITYDPSRNKLSWRY